MPSLAVFWFYQEIEHQCMFVKMAVEDIVSCRTADNKGLFREYYYLQVLLSSLGNISKILWPIAKKKNKVSTASPSTPCSPLLQLREARGRELREALNIKTGSPLKSRKLRDTFEHFDERMDEWFRKTERHGFSDRNVGSFEGTTVPRPSERLRTFVPETWTMVYCGREFKLSPTIRAVCGLYAEIQLKICQPGKHRGLLSEDILQELIEADNVLH